MPFQTWQVGLDIQNTQLCALAVQRRRNGWQLCHWWRQALPQDTLRNGVLQTSPALLHALKELGRQLPRRYSLRVGLPPQLVLQRPLPLPARQLHEPALGRYVTAAARQLFPVEPEVLSLDYRTSQEEGPLYVTAARRVVINQWVEPLQRAGLQISVLELSTRALAIVANAAGLANDHVLMVRQDYQWLWHCRASDPLAGSASLDTGLEELSQQFVTYASRVHCCVPGSISLPSTLSRFSPLPLFLYRQPPQPADESAFCIAAGLALRTEDSE